MSEVVEQVESIELSTEVEDITTTDAGAMSFDELDSITDDRSEEQLINEVSKNQAPPQKNQQQSEEASSSQEEQTSTEEAEEEIKKLVARYGEESLEIAANALFKHKVDGEEVDVELQELLNNYSGKMSYDKKFQELSDQRKEYESDFEKHTQEKNQINAYINDFANKLRNNDALGALEYFAEFAGMKPYEFRRELLSQIAPEVERRSMMSQEQLRAEELAMQNEYLMRQHEAVQQQYQEQQAVKELENEIVNVQEAYGISDEDFEKAYYELKESDFDGKIDPATVAEYHVHAAAYSKAEDILTQVDPMLNSQEPIVENLQRVIVENPSFDNNDLIEIVQQVYKDFIKESSKAVSKKASPKKQKSNGAQPASKEEYVDWDDF